MHIACGVPGNSRKEANMTSSSKATPDALFEYCAVCRKCCHVEEGYPPLRIPLLPAERISIRSLEIKKNCRFLSNTGCVKGAEKPFACSQYPLSFDPETNRFFFDSDCPLFEVYRSQLSTPDSPARSHFLLVLSRLQELKKTNPGYLKRNFALDADYFDLLPLPIPDDLLGPP